MKFYNADKYRIGVIGGSGLYELPGVEVIDELTLDTSFGLPSSSVLLCKIHDREVCFLPRHGKKHTIAPHEINHRSNILTLRRLGVRWLICVTAVGSLREEIHPRDLVVPNQFFDRTSRPSQNTFFGEGIVAHVSLAQPYSENLRHILIQSAKEEGIRCHEAGTYVQMDGPAFSTRAESEFYRKMGFDIVGMTHAPEAKLAREAEIACAALAFATDYDCWKLEEEPVTTEAVIEHLQANIANAKRILFRAILKIPHEPNWPEHFALDKAIITPREKWTLSRIRILSPLLDRFG
ncbi:MAG: S-methyl-5'-thioadenosine phosphorylase [Chthoniobacterales bacterium]|nr:S-methyl-5'-thioadenosine phosphorylase [Chthoniobacterales bacterium]MCX7712053.1 S-methyl-5'-thioadenosine phosphorylase [Chthoniobacterales bacterium]